MANSIDNFNNFLIQQIKEEGLLKDNLKKIWRFNEKNSIAWIREYCQGKNPIFASGNMLQQDIISTINIAKNDPKSKKAQVNKDFSDNLFFLLHLHAISVEKSALRDKVEAALKGLINLFPINYIKDLLVLSDRSRVVCGNKKINPDMAWKTISLLYPGENKLAQDLVLPLIKLKEQYNSSNSPADKGEISEILKSRRLEAVGFLLKLHESQEGNLTLQKDSETALKHIFINFPIYILNNFKFEKFQKEESPFSSSGLNYLAAKTLMARLMQELSPRQIQTLVESVDRSFREISPSTAEDFNLRAMQLQYLQHIAQQFPSDKEENSAAKANLIALVNTWSGTIPNDTRQQYGLAEPPTFDQIEFDDSFIAMANQKGMGKTAIEIDLLAGLRANVTSLNEKSLEQVKNTINELLGLRSTSMGSLVDTNSELQQYQQALEKTQQSNKWLATYQDSVDKDVEALREELNTIYLGLKAEVDNIPSKKQTVKAQYDAEVKKINDFRSGFLQINAIEQEKINRKQLQLKNAFSVSLQQVQAREDTIKKLMGDVQFELEALPTVESFKQKVVNTLDANLIALAEHKGELLQQTKDTLPQSRENLFNQLNSLSNQKAQNDLKNPISELLIQERGKFNKNIKLLTREEFGFKLEKEKRDFENEYQAIERENQSNIIPLIEKMNAIAKKIKTLKETVFTFQLPDGEEKSYSLAALEKYCHADNQYEVSRRESSSSLEMLQEMPAFYEAAVKEIASRNQAVSNLQTEYNRLQNQYGQYIEKNRTSLVKLATISSQLHNKITQIAEVDKVSKNLRRQAGEATTEITNAIANVKVAHQETVGAVRELSNERDTFVTNARANSQRLRAENNLPVAKATASAAQLDGMVNEANELVNNSCQTLNKTTENINQTKKVLVETQHECGKVLQALPVSFSDYCRKNASELKGLSFEERIHRYTKELNDINDRFLSESKNRERRQNIADITTLQSDLHSLTDNAKKSKSSFDNQSGSLMQRKESLVNGLHNESKAIEAATISKLSWARRGLITLASLGGAIAGAIGGAIAGFFVGGPLGAFIGGGIGAVGGASVTGGAVTMITPTPKPSKNILPEVQQSLVNNEAGIDEQVQQTNLVIVGLEADLELDAGMDAVSQLASSSEVIKGYVLRHSSSGSSLPGWQSTSSSAASSPKGKSREESTSDTDYENENSPGRWSGFFGSGSSSKSGSSSSSPETPAKNKGKASDSDSSVSPQSPRKNS